MKFTEAAAHSHSSLPCTTLSGSPAKAKMWMDSTLVNFPEISHLHADNEYNGPLQSCISHFQPASPRYYTQRHFSSLQSDMISLMQQFYTDITSIGEKVAHIETKMGAFAATVYDLIVADDENVEDHMWIKNKLVDLEHRSCCKNVKIRGDLNR